MKIKYKKWKIIFMQHALINLNKLNLNLLLVRPVTVALNNIFKKLPSAL